MKSQDHDALPPQRVRNIESVDVNSKGERGIALEAWLIAGIFLVSVIRAAIVLVAVFS
ncbi:MAG: hypothetical protein ACKOPE_14575 [Novosphingobium sp.]